MSLHVACIMDGNGRWATERGMARIQGHMAGYDVLEPIIESAMQNNVTELTLFVMSQENFLHRPAQEIESLFALFCKAVKEEAVRLREQAIAVKVIGDMSKLPQHVQRAYHDLPKLDQSETKLKVNLALNYSGQWHIEEAARKWASEGCQGNFDSYMDEMMTPVDILIRTGKEMRVSNSFLWHIAYSECFFPQCYWPDFTVDAFEDILNAYSKRQRRFGRISCPTNSEELSQA